MTARAPRPVGLADVLSLGAIGFIVLAGAYSTLVSTPTAPDATVYLEGGRRLNAGLSIYDANGFAMQYPPLLAVVWRLPAALPGNVGLALGWAADICATMALVGFLLSRRSVKVSAAVLLLAMPIGFELALANINGILALGCAVVWRYRDRWWAGAVLATIASLKLAPLVLVAWLLGQRRWAALAGFAAAAVGCLIAVLLGAGVQSIPDYIAVIPQQHPFGQSVAALLGIPFLPYLGMGAAALFALVLYRRAALVFAIACASMVLGSLGFTINWLVLLLPAVAALSDKETASQWMEAAPEPAPESGVRHQRR
jgi:Glycosyltransferase family 87